MECSLKAIYSSLFFKSTMDRLESSGPVVIVTWKRLRTFRKDKIFESYLGGYHTVPYPQIIALPLDRRWRPGPEILWTLLSSFLLQKISVSDCISNKIQSWLRPSCLDFWVSQNCINPKRSKPGLFQHPHGIRVGLAINVRRCWRIVLPCRSASSDVSLEIQPSYGMPPLSYLGKCCSPSGYRSQDW